MKLLQAFCTTKYPTIIFAIITLLFAYLFICSEVYAHSGGLNSQGCHGGSKPYHCHRSSSEMVPSTSGGYRLRCSAGSRSKDCNTSIPSYKKDNKNPITAPKNGYVSGDSWYCDNGYKRDFFEKTCTKN